MGQYQIITGERRKDDISADKWVNYFCNLFQSNLPESVTTGHNLDDDLIDSSLNMPITEAEIRAAIQKLKTPKTPGMDGYQLMRQPDFKHMYEMIDKYSRDAALAALVGKDGRQMDQQAQDGHFFRILARMMTEVCMTRGLSQQKEVLKKVHKWYMANRSVLNCLPHFGSDRRSKTNKTVLRFAPDVIAHYTSPRTPSSINKPKREDELDIAVQKVSLANKDKETKSTTSYANDKIKIGENRQTGLKRPTTAPPVLERSKPAFGEMKSSEFQGASFTGQYVAHNLVPKPPRPASAVSIMRMSSKSPYGDKMPFMKEISKDEKPTRPETASSIGSSISINLPSSNDHSPHISKVPKLIPKGMTVAEVINPTAQLLLEEENYDTDGYSPDSRSSSAVRRLQVSVPTDEATMTPKHASPTPEEKKAANLKAWEEFKQKQSYGQDFIGRLQFYGRSGTPHGIRYSSHEACEKPEYYTDEVIASYAVQSEDTVSKDSDDHDRITYQSLENFYKETETYCMDPKQRGQTPPVKLRHNVPTDPVSVHVPSELTQDARIKSAIEQYKRHPSVKFDTIVDLTETVREHMEESREKIAPDAKYGYHQPAMALHKRPSTAPDRIMSTPVPPNSDRPSSASSISSESSSRNQKGEPVVLLPDRSEYSMHARSARETNLNHIKTSGKTQPDTTRYKKPDSARKNLRTAGSVPMPSRPTTCTATPRERWTTPRESTSNQRVNQAASHMTTSVDSELVAKMVMVNHLGGEQNRRPRSRMGRMPGVSGFEAELPRLPPTLQFLSISGPVHIKVKGQEDNESMPAGPPQSPKENNSVAPSVTSSRDNLSFNSFSGQSSGTPFFDDTPRFDEILSSLATTPRCESSRMENVTETTSSEEKGPEGMSDNVTSSEEKGPEGMSDNVTSSEEKGPEGMSDNVTSSEEKRPEGMSDNVTSSEEKRPEEKSDNEIITNLDENKTTEKSPQITIADDITMMTEPDKQESENIKLMSGGLPLSTSNDDVTKQSEQDEGETAKIKIMQATDRLKADDRGRKENDDQQTNKSLTENFETDENKRNIDNNEERRNNQTFEGYCSDDNDVTMVIYDEDGPMHLSGHPVSFNHHSGSSGFSRCNSPRSVYSEKNTTTTGYHGRQSGYHGNTPASTLQLQYSSIHIPITPAPRSSSSSRPNSAASQKYIAQQSLRPSSAQVQRTIERHRPVRPVSAYAKFNGQTLEGRKSKLNNRASSSVTSRTKGPEWKGRPLPMYGAPQDKIIPLQRKENYEKYCRGWRARKIFEKVKEKALQHCSTLKEFIDLYNSMLKRIMKRHRVKKPKIRLNMYEMEEFMDRKRMYESKFDQLAYPGDELEIHELSTYFRECGLYPGEREYLDFLRLVIKSLTLRPENP
uniref:Uncharacterized protein LOC100367864 n=1 Tax=Saccoglossus kowalevskii TaxID=10224 RepID=A0ABM0M0H9_SACKO|nr:PREDICTED: uncharacterized protein LOC100367864 [Saccoglossus kowalevskii]